MTHRILITLVASLLSLLPSAYAAEAPGELYVAIPWTPENLDPSMNLSSIRDQVDMSQFNFLVGRVAQNRIAPQLVES